MSAMNMLPAPIWKAATLVNVLMIMEQAVSHVSCLLMIDNLLISQVEPLATKVAACIMTWNHAQDSS